MQRVIHTLRESRGSSVNNGNDINETFESTCEARITDQGNVIGELPEALQANPDDIVRLFGDSGVFFAI